MATEKINVCEVYEEELGEDEPIEYEGLTFYPVKIKNMYKLMRSVDVLLYDNLNYPDDELAGLPRLSFLRQMILRAKTEQDNLAAQVLALKLQMLFSIVFLDLETFSIVYPAQPKRDVFYFKMKNGKHVVITNKKFENIRHIILEQNGIKYRDEFVHQSILDKQAEDAKIKARGQGDPPTTEDLIDFYVMFSHMPLGYVKRHVSMRKLNRFIDKYIDVQNFEICKTGEMGGMVKFKEEIPHWLRSHGSMETKFKDMSDEVEKYKEKLKSI